MSHVTILRGLPASGKSTWAKDQVAKSGGRIVRVNKDDIRDELHGGKWSKENEIEVLDERDRRIANALGDGKDVIVDDTNFADKHLKAVANIAGAHGATFEVKYFYCPPSICEERDALREKAVGPKVIRRMWRDYVVKPAPKFDPSLPTVVVCDIDGTVARMTGRSPYDYTKVDTDVVVEVVRDLVLAHENLIFCSGREAGCRPETENWLAKNGLGGYIKLLMRSAGDHRPDWIVKRELYESEIKGKYNVLFVLDDRQQVVDMWREEGLTCLQVADGRF